MKLSLLLSGLLLMPFLCLADVSHTPDMKLNTDDRMEVQTIKDNYHRYGPLLRKIALERIGEIYNKILSDEVKIKMRQSAIENIMQDPTLPPDILEVVSMRQQGYMSLPEETRKELIAYSMNLKTLEQLSETAKNYLYGRNLLISNNMSTEPQGNHDDTVPPLIGGQS